MVRRLNPQYARVMSAKLAATIRYRLICRCTLRARFNPPRVLSHELWTTGRTNEFPRPMRTF